MDALAPSGRLQRERDVPVHVAPRDDAKETPGTRCLKTWLSLALPPARVSAWSWDIDAEIFEIAHQWHGAEGLPSAGAAAVDPVRCPIESWRHHVHVEDRPAFQRFIRALRVDRGKIREVTIRLCRADGSYERYVCRGRAVASHEGRTSLAAGVLLEADAARGGVERHDQLQRLATIGEVTGGLAHDFNNLLGVIQGNVELLGDTLDDPAQAAILKEIGEVIERASTVTRRLLSLARRDDAGGEEIEPGPVLRQLVPLLGHSLGGRMTLTTQFDAPDCTVRADACAFENAVLNLVINARDAMPAGGSIALATRIESLSPRTARPGERPGAYVVVSVRDTGHGIPADIMLRIVEPFFTTKAEKGSGLGMAMVARFVEQSGGHMRIDSTVGRGTQIHLYLPIARRPALA